MIVRYIGDVHGKYDPYKKIIRDCDRSIQVGDLGVGFYSPCRMTGALKSMQNPPHQAMTEGSHRFIRGNHDNPLICRGHSQSISDGTIEGDTMYIGGALSIDRQWRTEGLDWWADEELSYTELDRLITIYSAYQPHVMVTHDCPESHATNLVRGYEKTRYPSRTREAFQSMIETHRPEVWIHGHWHVDLDVTIDNTRFICLGELSYIDLDMDDLTAGKIISRN
jgi:hypothetical protein